MGRQAIARLQHRTALSTELLTAAQRLRLLREKDQRAALTDRQKVQVALYVLVRPDADRNDAERRTAEALGASNRRGWQVAFRAVDTTGDLAPALRPQLARVHDAVSDQRIAGVVCASRVDISQDDSLYTDELNWLRSRGGFLALARNEAAL
ncbi:hypothetical protein [Streptomyces sp. 8L]|uniref:hypothetical protein n=1 Tax=Streptomyces sp. 8L TaxID=2877242 RepID=UPI001CD31B43|nr:hypothetical protein [Streptomyces sp. 8L]MCA1223265.1 hypothetical protein [Streptomyces sp. 8L]